MLNKQTSISLMGQGVLMLGLLSLNGCDYWPPALQSHIEGLRSELNDVLDDRQRLDLELTELRVVQASLQREIEEKAHENEVLRKRLAARPRISSRPSPTRHNRQAKAGIVTKKSSASEVKRIQRLLRRHDLLIRVDGIYGRTTVAAVRSFQRVHGLRADGVVGPATYRALNRPAPTVRSVRHLRLQRPPLTGRDVSRVQRHLRRAGHRIPIDGNYGPVTDVAVTQFQRKHGIEPDGIVGPQTLAALKKIP